MAVTDRVTCKVGKIYSPDIYRKSTTSAAELRNQTEGQNPTITEPTVAELQAIEQTWIEDEVPPQSRSQRGMATETEPMADLAQTLGSCKQRAPRKGNSVMLRAAVAQRQTFQTKAQYSTRGHK